MLLKGTLTILGSGTSQGIPVIGCDCEICRSTNPKDKRLRTAALISFKNHNIAIDCGPDFRTQMLQQNVNSLQAVLLTHEHNDHIIGLDDVRPFNFMTRQDMPIYATKAVIQNVVSRFAYIFDQKPYPGAPRLIMKEINKNQVLQFDDLKIQPIEVIHGKIPVLGFRMGSLAYVTDAKTINSVEKSKLEGLDTLILNALHHNPHHSHLNLEEALELIEVLQPRQAFLTHVSHRMGLHEQVNQQLPAHIQLCYDGLELDFEWEV